MPSPSQEANARAHPGPPPYWTALHQAASAKLPGQTSEQVLRALVEAKADLEARNGRGCSPLHLAAGGGNVPGVTCLLGMRADCEAPAGFNRHTVYCFLFSGARHPSRSSPLRVS